MKIGVFFGSTSYGTQEAAELVRDEFARQAPAATVDLVNVAKRRAEDLGPYELLVFGTSTWGLGGLQHDWDAFIWELRRADLTGKTAAVFALGDQVVWSETFVNSMAQVHDAAAARGAAMVGSWPTEGYAFDRSESVRDGRFVGLALDRMNQRELSPERVRRWVGQVLGEWRARVAGGAGWRLRQPRGTAPLRLRWRRRADPGPGAGQGEPEPPGGPPSRRRLPSVVHRLRPARPAGRTRVPSARAASCRVRIGGRTGAGPDDSLPRRALREEPGHPRSAAGGGGYRLESHGGGGRSQGHPIGRRPRRRQLRRGHRPARGRPPGGRRRRASARPTTYCAPSPVVWAPTSPSSSTLGRPSPPAWGTSCGRSRCHRCRWCSTCPREELSTPRVYAEFDRLSPSESASAFAARAEGAEVRWLAFSEGWRSGAMDEVEAIERLGAGLLANDLYPAGLSLLPELAQRAAVLAGHGALGVLMSGSGPTMFGVWGSDGAAAAAAAELASAGHPVKRVTAGS